MRNILTICPSNLTPGVAPYKKGERLARYARRPESSTSLVQQNNLPTPQQPHNHHHHPSTSHPPHSNHGEPAKFEIGLIKIIGIDIFCNRKK